MDRKKNLIRYYYICHADGTTIESINELIIIIIIVSFGSIVSVVIVNAAMAKCGRLARGICTKLCEIVRPNQDIRVNRPHLHMTTDQSALAVQLIFRIFCFVLFFLKIQFFHCHVIAIYRRFTYHSPR